MVAPAHAAFPGANGKIAFDEFGGSGCIYSINPDGTGRTPATPCGVPAERFPQWAPDGRKLAYYANADQRNEYVTDGQNPMLIFSSGDAELGFGWSPDASKIVDASDHCEDDTCTGHLRRVSLDGSDNTDIHTDPVASPLRTPAWSPDGSKIAVTNGAGTLYTISPDGTGLTTVVSCPGCVYDPNWSPDGSKIAFWRAAFRWEIWVMNADGTGQSRLTTGAFDTDPTWSPDGTKIAFESDRDAPASCRGNAQESCPADIFVMNADGTGLTNITNTPTINERDPDWQPIPLNYIRPKAAAPTRVSLVPAYAQCNPAEAYRTHGPPLAFPSCTPPTQSSGELTIGTADANGAPTKSVSFVRYGVQLGNPATPADEANVRIIASVTDVRKASDLSDYTGELQLDQGLRITDRDNTPYPGGSGPATVTDAGFPVTIPCGATADTSVGSTCAVDTTADAILPNTVKEGRRAVWQVGQVHVFDGGPDGVASTPGNTLFMDQGVFVP
jgi:hypothetical protein